MTTGANQAKAEFSSAAIDLFNLLKENHFKFRYHEYYDVGFRQREGIIKEVFASNGGKEIIENAIKFIDFYLQKINDAKARADAADKKHFLFKPESEDKKFYKTHKSQMCHAKAVREEMSTICRVAKVIESTRFNKPTVG